jgi:hypothetical protein
MFPRMNYASPFQPLAYGAPQYGVGAGIGAISPIVSPLANPYVCDPVTAALCGIGPYPYASYFAGAPGVIPQAAPMIPAQMAQFCPPISPLAWRSPASVGSQVPCIDPVTGCVIPPQAGPIAQSLLPIRPLIAPQACDPYQLAALCGVSPMAATDPYTASALAQACMTQSVGVSPIHPAVRQQLVGTQMAVPCPPLGAPGPPLAMACPPVVAIPGINC